MVGGQLNRRIGYIIQARMGSSRLPNKVVLPLPFPDGPPLLERIITTLKKLEGTIVLATSTHKENDALQSLAEKLKINCFRGDEQDVLSRFVKIQRKFDFDIIVRFTADNPLIDVCYLKEAINELLEKEYDEYILNSVSLDIIRFTS